MHRFGALMLSAGQPLKRHFQSKQEAASHPSDCTQAWLTGMKKCCQALDVLKTGRVPTILYYILFIAEDKSKRLKVTISQLLMK